MTRSELGAAIGREVTRFSDGSVSGVQSAARKLRTLLVLHLTDRELEALADVRELAALTDERLLRIPGFGPTTLKAFRQLLSGRNWHVVPDGHGSWTSEWR
jgi:hypothetical protein